MKLSSSHRESSGMFFQEIHHLNFREISESRTFCRNKRIVFIMIRFTPTTVVTALSINDASIKASDNLMIELNAAIILDIEFMKAKRTKEFFSD